jgi:hypothetical protein
MAASQTIRQTAVCLVALVGHNGARPEPRFDPRRTNERRVGAEGLELDAVLRPVLPPSPAKNGGRNGGHHRHGQTGGRAENHGRRRCRPGHDALAPRVLQHFLSTLAHVLKVGLCARLGNQCPPSMTTLRTAQPTARPAEGGVVLGRRWRGQRVTSQRRGRTATAAYRTVVARACDRVHRATVSMSAAERSFS